MKVFFIVLLAAVLCMDSGSSLKCFSCKSTLSNNNCKEVVNCSEKNTCKTEVIRIIGVFNIISKGCEPTCAADFQDFKVGNRNVSCCNTDLCNVNAAGSVRCNYGMAAGISASVLWAFLNNRW
ncbi:prostate stem cell antigen-like [Oxyura jamaicensis]|uniref:prostate stem cell antigen-like n=1 Tax=Oxyura jamaicensis TaxID=8884 RepID=UPI0015A645B8|nr:prostate stem cell antigen-like [Oxyura jamaicensis]